MRCDSLWFRALSQILWVLLLIPTLPRMEWGGETIEWRFVPAAAHAAPPTPFDAPDGFAPVLSVSRSVSPATLDAVVDGKATLTYRVLNRNATALDDVLLTTELAAGVTYAGATNEPSRSGSGLAWSLGSVAPGGLVEVSVDVELSAPLPSELDSGADVFGMLASRAVSTGTSPARLADAGVDPALLACTIDANCDDPIVQAKASELGYDALAIFDYVRDSVRYEAYTGSLRGARGTLWSEAGNALDQASLLVALLRASGIPARYAEGTLALTDAQALVLSMFPTTTRFASLIPADATLADPANDPALLAHVQDHAWVQLDLGAGLQSADPSIAGSAIGSANATVTATFDEVPASSRHHVRFRLETETRNVFDAGIPPRETVLDESFSTAELVGVPVTLGHFVSTQDPGGAVFTNTTYTYSPFLRIRGLDPDPEAEDLIRGDDYQEFLTNFAGASEYLTGVFFTIDNTTPGGTTESFERSLVDRIGPAARAGGGDIEVAIDTSEGPAITTHEAWSTSVRVSAPSFEPMGALVVRAEALRPEAERLEAEAQAGPENVTDFELRAGRLGSNLTAIAAESVAHEFDRQAYEASQQVAEVMRAIAYPASAQITTGRSALARDGQGFSVALDIVEDALEVVVPPEQVTLAALAYPAALTSLTNTIEGDVVDTGGFGVAPAVTAFRVIEAAEESGIALETIGAMNVADLDALPIPADVRARMAEAIAQGRTLLAPATEVSLNGELHYGWIETFEDGRFRGRLPDRTGGAHIMYGGIVWIVSGPGSAAIGGFVLTFTVGVITFAAAIFFEIGFSLATGTKASFKGAAGKAIRAAISAGGAACTPLGTFAGFCFGGSAIAVAFLSAVLGLIWLDPALPEAGLSAPIGSIPSATFEDVFFASSLAASSLVSLAASGSAGSLRVAGGIDTTLAPPEVVGGTTLAFDAPTATIDNLTDGGTLAGDALAEFERVSVGIDVPSLELAGTGSVSLYPGATSGVSGGATWASLSGVGLGAAVSELPTEHLSVDGAFQPAGRYRVSSTDPSLVGAGDGFAPVFETTSQLEAADAAVALGPIGGAPTGWPAGLPVDHGVTLLGFDGSVDVSAGASAHAVALAGSAEHALAVGPAPTALMLAAGTSGSFDFPIVTTLADDYTLSAEAPLGFEVSIDATGTVEVGVAPDTAPGTYAVRLSARSVSEPDLVANGEVVIAVGAGTAAVSVEIVPDPLLSLKLDETYFNSSFYANVQNLGPATDTFALDPTTLPPGFALDASADAVTLRPGERGEIGLYLTPDAGLPAPGTTASFGVEVTSQSNAAVSDTASGTFVVPDIHGLVVDFDGPGLALAPGETASIDVTIRSVGNVGATADLAAILGADLALAGLPSSITVPFEGEQTISLDVSADAAAMPGTNASLEVEADLCQGLDLATCAVAPLAQQSRDDVPILVRTPELVDLWQTVLVARLGPPDIALELGAAARDIGLLQSDPGNDALCSRVATSIENLQALLGADPDFAVFVPDFDTLLAAAQTCSTSGLVAGAAGAGSDLGDYFENQRVGGFALTLSPQSVVLDTAPTADVTLTVTNLAEGPNTIDLTPGMLPPLATLTPPPSDVTLAPGADASFALTLSHPIDANAVFPVGVSGTSREAPVSRDASVVGRVVPATADLVAVTASPSAVTPGDDFAVGATVLNSANAAVDLVAHVEVLDASGMPLASHPARDVPFSLAPSVSVETLDLGTETSGALPDGLYTLRVALRFPDGSPAAPGPKEALVVVGGLVTLTGDVTPEVVPPGTPRVTTNLGVTPSALTTASPEDAVVEWHKVVFAVEPESNRVTSTPAVGDLDGDGYPEIVTVTQKTVGQGGETLRAISSRPRAVTNEILTQHASAVVTATSSRVATGTPRLLDGDPFTDWSADFSLVQLDQRVFVTFEELATISEVRVFGDRQLNPAQLHNLERARVELLDRDGNVLASSGSVTSVVNPDQSRDFVFSFADVANVHQVRFVPEALEAGSLFLILSGLEVVGDAIIRGDVLWNITDVRDGPPAIGDIDGDGELEIIAKDRIGFPIAVEADGSIKWTGNFPIAEAPSLTDLDGDGTPEIIGGRRAFSTVDGSVLLTGLGGTGGAGLFGTAYSYAADVDVDGAMEVVAGNTLYAADMTTDWQAPIPDARTAVANLDADPQGEIVAVTVTDVYRLEHDGTVTWGPVTIPGVTRCGPPLVANLLGDATPEIGVACTDFFTALDAAGNVLWQTPIQESSSGTTTSTVFDIQGDGLFEILYRDEQDFMILDGTDGSVRTRIPMAHGTFSEAPVLADVDADGHAEVVAVADGGIISWNRERGVYVVGGGENGWRPTRRIWNQHAYSVTHVEEDGSIPTYTVPPWSAPERNHFRANEFAATDTGTGAVDLVHELAAGIAADAGSIDPAPANTPSDAIEWALGNVFALGGAQASFEGTLIDALPGTVHPVSDGTTATVLLDFDGNGMPLVQDVTLPPLSVAVAHVIAIDPGSRDVDPGSSTSYQVTLANPGDASDTFALHTVGLEGFDTTLPSSVVVPAGGTTAVSLDVAAPSDAVAESRTIAVVATLDDGSGASDAAFAELTVRDTAPPAPPLDPGGVAVSLLPAVSTAGPGTPAGVVSAAGVVPPKLRIVNLGSETRQFDLSGVFPAGFAASFAVPSVAVPPGLGNAVSVALTLVPPVGAPAGTEPFTVTATDSGDATRNASASGSVTLTEAGVTLAFSMASVEPGESVSLLVTNTGGATDTFALALGGGAALVTSGLPASLTLAPGASQTLVLDVGSIDYAVTGELDLVARAVSQNEPAVAGRASTRIGIEERRGVTASLSPGATLLTEAGEVLLEFDFRNTGTLEDEYAIALVGSTSPVSASLADETGGALAVTALLPANTLGKTQLRAKLESEGTGMVSVRVTSLTDPAVSALAVASLTLDLPQAPVADIVAPASVPFGDPVPLDGSGSFDPDSGPDPLAYAWRFVTTPAASGLTSIPSADQPTTAFQPDVRGTYEIELEVSDGALADTAIHTVVVENNAPVAAAGDDANVGVGEVAALDGSASFDPDGDLITFAWAFESLPGASSLADADLMGATTPVPSFVPDVAGSYTLRLTVSDGEGGSDFDLVDRVAALANVPPNAVVLAPTMGLVGTPLALDGSTSNDPDAGPQPLSFAWSFVATPSGSALGDPDISGDGAGMASFTPDVPGVFRVRLSVADGDLGDAADVDLQVELPNVSPTADAGDDPMVLIGDVVVLDGSGSHDPDAGPAPLGFAWRFVSVPPGSALTQIDLDDPTTASPSFEPDVVGEYVLELEVFDGLASDFDNVMVKVRSDPVDVGDAALVTSANEQSVLDPFTRQVHSTADLTLTNVGVHPLAVPIHAAFVFQGSGIQVPDADGTNAAGEPFYDVGDRGALIRLEPGDSTTFPVRFEYPIGTVFSYDVRITAVVDAAGGGAGTPVPEPGGALPLLIAAFALAGLGRRRTGGGGLRRSGTFGRR